MSGIAHTDPEKAIRRQLALAYGAFLHAGWAPQWAGPNRLVGTSRFLGKNPVDLIIFDTDGAAYTLEVCMPDGEHPGNTGMQRHRKAEFTPAFAAVRQQAVAADIEKWEAAVQRLATATDLILTEQKADAENIDAAMPYAAQGLTATFSLIAINTLVFIIMAFAGVGVFEADVEKLVDWGANWRPYTEDGQWWRLVTCYFLHAGVFHLLLNMITLLQVGVYLEPLIGRWRLLLLYMISGIGASLASLYFHNDPVVSVGASGAVFGFFGCFLVLLLSKTLPPNFRKAMLITMGVLVGLNLLNGLKDGIDNAAHIGGLLTGALVGLTYRFALKRKSTALIRRS
ncbi:MAG: rhomboid family intramembrane serine protease [Chitinophagaceae bacterium]|nr:MAG: rhomboid family intramembrane serine protease [Chitinophagaceae bacterium]